MKSQPRENRVLQGDVPCRQCLCTELSEVEYKEVWNLQQAIVAARKDKILNRDVILLLEHSPVFTLGRRGGLENLMVSKAFLKKTGIEVIHTERGGNITFHGPGQLVGYPIIDLRAARLSVVDYVNSLEEVMIRTATDYGVRAERNPMNRGIWVGNSKMGSIGIAVRRGISFHGFALNVNLSLKPFQWINPCGLRGIGVTSLARETTRQIPMHRVRTTVERHMQAIFGIKLESTKLSELRNLLKKQEASEPNLTSDVAVLRT